MKRLFMAACFATLAACGADSDEREVVQKYREEMEAANASLIYSFPADGQEQVPTPSPVVLRFSSAVTDTAPDIRVRKKGGTDLAIARIETPDSGRSMVLYPDGDLDPLTEYEVVIPAINLQKGTTEARTISFRTGALAEGAASQVGESTFRLVRTIPDNQGFDIVTDMSTFRVQFSQPLDRSSIDYGNTVKLATSAGVTVPAHVLVSGSYLTVDPKADLNPSQQYTLTVTTDVRSASGNALPSNYTLTFTPADTTSPTTGDRSVLIQDVADTGESPLTGAPINLIPMASVLLGEETATQSRGVIGAELAYAPNFPDITPLRIPRGMLLRGEAIDVLIGGSVDAGPTLPDSGEVTITFLSDATGYMIENPYSNSESAPRLIHLYMDVGVSTDRPAANGAITQTIQHIELVGTAFFEGDALEVNAVGMVEPDIMGSEHARGLLSFYMKAFDDQDSAPAPDADHTPPTLTSWSPGDHIRSQRVTDPIIFTFSEAIDPTTVASAGITLTETTASGSRAVDLDWYVRGASLVIKPKEVLKRPVQTGPGIVDDVSYRVILGNGVADFAGNTVLLDSNEFEFSFPLQVTEVVLSDWRMATETPEELASGPGLADIRQSPLVLFAYPGYPCAMEDPDLPNDVAGRCKGALAEHYESLSGNVERVPDDMLPLMPLPANRPIVVHFSKEIDAQSVSVGGSFLVQEVALDGSPLDDVPGRVVVDGNRLTFYPDNPWTPGVHYRYVLGSNGDDMEASEPVVCDGSGAICDLTGLPLQTVLYSMAISAERGILEPVAAEGTAGGPDMVNYFRGAPPSRHVLMAMVNESWDTNANFYHDVNHPFPEKKLGFESVSWWPDYSVEEARPDVFEPDPAADPLLDPQGIRPVENSAKVISKTPGTAYSGGPQLTGISVGCGWETIVDPAAPRVVQSCPEQKLTYLTSAIAAEITDEVDPVHGVKALIWPGQIMSTALRVSNLLIGQNGLSIDGGPMLMRMRYAKDDPTCTAACARTQPITGWIRDVDGRPVLTAQVDIYIDAIRLKQTLMTLGLGTGTSHNLASVPASMELSGEISFLDNGQMVVEQVNVSEMEIPFEIEVSPAGAMGDFVLAVPAGGSRLVYYGDKVY